MSLYANRYEKLKTLGRGSSGSVFLVKDQRTGLFCALKVLRSVHGKLTRATLETFKKEFQILKNLNHPSIAKVYDAGLDETEEGVKLFYMATEYVDGEDLFSASEKLSTEQIENLFVQALRAFHYLHTRKIYHL